MSFPLFRKTLQAEAGQALGPLATGRYFWQTLMACDLPAGESIERPQCPGVFCEDSPIFRRVLTVFPQVYCNSRHFEPLQPFPQRPFLTA